MTEPNEPTKTNLLHGVNVALRAREQEDVSVLQDALYNDISTRARADTRPWIPIPKGDPALSPYSVTSVSDKATEFSIVAASNDQELVGEALLYGIDAHNRSAHLGLALIPAFRGRGWSGEVVHLLCRYGFVVRGLNRLQLETDEKNLAMISSAKKAGFVEEGRMRNATWVLGSFTDQVVMGLLAKEWKDG